MYTSSQQTHVLNFHSSNLVAFATVHHEKSTTNGNATLIGPQLLTRSLNRLKLIFLTNQSDARERGKKKLCLVFFCVLLTMKGCSPVGYLLCGFVLFVLVRFSVEHVALTFPPARKYDLDFLDNSRTKAPCGMPKGNVRRRLNYLHYIYTSTYL